MKPAALKSASTANTARRFFLAARALTALAMAAVLVPGAIPALALAATPQVTNVLAVQRSGTKLVDVTYDVLDADGHAMTVALYISPDGGVSFPIQGVTVTGDVGAGVMSGMGRHIVWDAGADYPGHVGETYAPKVTADDGQGFDGMIWIPAGNMLLGQAGVYGSEPVHDFYVAGFYIDRYEVSNVKYKAFIDAGGYATEAYWSPVGWAWRVANNVTLPAYWNCSAGHCGGIAGNEQFPVNGVSWFEADAYCRWAGGRLPTEAEWEKAAKGGCETHGDPGTCDASDTPSYPWGEGLTGPQANYYQSGDPYDYSGYTTPVGYYDGSNHGGYQTIDSPSPYGLYDVAGNVYEWCSTKWAYYPYNPNDGRENPPVSSSACCWVLRGGTFNVCSSHKSAYRYYSYPNTRDNGIGFRCARTGSPAAAGWGVGPLFHLDTRSVGACCHDDYTCTPVPEAECLSPGIWLGEWTTCSPSPCCPDGESYTNCRIISDSGILFAERYSTEAPPDTAGFRIFYDSTRVEITRDPDTRFYISGRPDSLSPWVCDDVFLIHDDATGEDWAPEFGQSTIMDTNFPLCEPIDSIITTIPAGEVTSYVPMGTSCVTFKLADTRREIFGNTAIYLLRVTDPTNAVFAATLEFQKIRVTPNPTGSATTVDLCSRDGGPHTLTIYAPDGRVIRTFPQVLLARGQRQAWVWDSKDQTGRVVSPGVYFCSIQTPTGRLSARALVLR